MVFQTTIKNCRLVSVQLLHEQLITTDNNNKFSTVMIVDTCRVQFLKRDL